MDLFEVINGHAFPSTHALLIQPFKRIWENDLSEDKGDAIKMFTYIELMCSPKKSNPFFGYDETIRTEKVKKEVFRDEQYPTTTDMMLGIMTYKELLENSSPGYALYLSSLKAAETLEKYLNSIDLNERTNSGGAVIKPGDVTKALKEIPDVIKALQGLREKVHTELAEEAKTRNQREVGDYER